VKNRVKSLPTLAAGTACLAVLVSACGSGSDSSQTTSSSSSAGSQTVKVDVGNGTVTLPKGKLRIGIFMNALSNEWQKAVASTAKAQAEAAGHSVTTMDAGFDVGKQLNQIQTAATNKSFDAAVVLPIDGKQECNAVTKILPKANVLVSIVADQACGRDLQTGNGLWPAGALNFVGGDSTVPYFRALLDNAAKLSPGRQRVAIVAGPELNPSTVLEKEAVRQFQPSHPDFKVTDFVYTDFTTPSGYQKTQDYLRAHPEVTVVLSVYSPDLSRGVVNAVKALGKTGKIKIADAGGSKYTVDQIKAGTIQMTLGYFPKENGRLAVQSILDAHAGKPPVRFISDVRAKFGTVDKPLVITKENLSSYTPEY
jgi:ribose transport system substrate-binding protein